MVGQHHTSVHTTTHLTTHSTIPNRTSPNPVLNRLRRWIGRNRAPAGCGTRIIVPNSKHNQTMPDHTRSLPCSFLLSPHPQKKKKKKEKKSTSCPNQTAVIPLDSWITRRSSWRFARFPGPVEGEGHKSIENLIKQDKSAYYSGEVPHQISPCQTIMITFRSTRSYLPGDLKNSPDFPDATRTGAREEF